MKGSNHVGFQGYLRFYMRIKHFATIIRKWSITTEQEAKALATLEDDKDKSLPKKWLGDQSGLSGFCGLRPLIQ
jgi:hypothetical protein